MFLIEKGEEKATEYQLNVISFLQDAKISCFVNARQAVIEEFFKLYMIFLSNEANQGYGRYWQVTVSKDHLSIEATLSWPLIRCSL